MRIDAFSAGKYLDDPDANEDQLVALPGCGYAVIDGVTDISGRMVDGMRTGRYASRIVQRAVTDILCDPVLASSPAEHIVDRITGAMHAAYVRLGIVDEVHANAARRFGATLTLAIERAETFRFVFVGDSGLRINGVEQIVDWAGLDRVTAALRQQSYRLVAELGGSLERQREISRLASYYGAASLHRGMQPELDAAALATLHARTLDQARALFPGAPEDDVRHLIDTGISGQTRFQNTTASPFGYSVFDGFPVPMALVHVIERPRASIRSLELFTDGYFEPGESASVDAWERAADAVERIDPEKIDRYPSVKGSSARMRTDDRTVLIAHF